MALDFLSHGKLEKLKFLDEKTKEPLLEAMYNPNELTLEYTNCYEKIDPLIVGGEAKFLHGIPRTVTVKLPFDGTGASPSTTILGSLPVNLGKIGDALKGNKISIKEKINYFLKEAYRIKGENHEPRKLIMMWGVLYFPCVITSASVSYNLFSPKGVPLRGTLTLSLKEFLKDQNKEDKKKLLSPDLTKSYMVQEGDRLDALCQKMYEDPSLYHEVARVNNLKNPRKLAAGQTLVFPPINKLE